MSESKCSKCAELEAELEHVQKQAAAMREALRLCECYVHHFQVPEIRTCLESDAGVNYVSKDAVRPLRDALQSLVAVGVECVDGKPATYAWLGPESRKRINDALDHARTITI